LDTFPAEAVQSFRDVVAAELPPHPDERFSAFRHLLTVYGSEKLIPVYNVFSGGALVSLEGARAFFQDKDGAIRLWQEPRKGVPQLCEMLCLGIQLGAALRKGFSTYSFA
jgi:hypothetical protein